MATAIELWFDFSCPYAYLASTQAPALAAQLGVTIAWRPMLLGGVFRGIGAGDGPMATISPVRAAHNLRDMHRWAERFGVPLTMPAAHPMRTVRALRTLLRLPEAHWPAAIEAIYAAYWVHGYDITSDAVLAETLRAIPGSADAVATADLAKDELRARTDEAISLGIFGAPAWYFRDRAILVWGQDRLPWIAAIARGWDPRVNANVTADADVFADATGERELRFYFDVGSPYAYLALTQLSRLHPSPTLRPILLGGLFRSVGTVDVPLFAFPEAKRRYIVMEMQRWARWYGVPFRMPSKFPQRTQTAQRLILLAAAHGAAAQVSLARALAHALWADDGDLEADTTLAAVLVSVGLPAALLAATREPAAKQALVAATTAAADAGIFGVPSYVVMSPAPVLVWGQDRVELVTALLGGWQPRGG